MISTQYLETAMVEKLHSELEADGYHVEAEPHQIQPRFDLIASKGNEKIAYEVTARIGSTKRPEVIHQLRERARREGYRFRLVFVNPPRERTIEISGLRQALQKHLLAVEPMPPELVHLAPHTSIDRIRQLDINSIQVDADQIRITGVGLLEINLEWDGTQTAPGTSWSEGFPFDVDASLDRDLNVKDMRLQIDVSSWAPEPTEEMLLPESV